MKAINNPGAQFTFMHAGQTYVCPSGVTVWDDDLARHLQKKRAALGVRIVVLPHSEPQDLFTVPLESIAVPEEPMTESEPTPEPTPEPVPLPEETQTPAEAAPEPPAAPIEGEKPQE